MPVKIGLDLGYGQTKAMNDRGESVVFPSVVGTGHARPLENALGSSDRPQETDLDLVIRDLEQEDHLFVGELAQRECRDMSYAFADNKISHPNTRGLLLAACAMLNSYNEPIELVTGLPIQHYHSQKDRLRDYLRKIDARVTFQSGALKANIRHVQFAEVTVLPQAGAALYGEFIDLDGTIKATQHLGYAAVLDPGAKTTDYAVIDPHHDLDYINKFSGTFNMGMNTAYLAIKKGIENATGLNIPMTALDNTIRQRRLLLNGKSYDLTPIIDRAFKNLAKAIRDHLDQEWNARQEFAIVYVCGGGGAALWEYLKDLHGQTRLVDEPVFANARGYLSLAQALEVARHGA